MCVCLGSMCSKIVVERYFWEFKMLFGSLIELHAWLHSYLCFSFLEKLFLSNLDAFLTPLDTWPICQDLKLLLIAISIAVLTAGGLIGKFPGPSKAFRQLVDRLRFFLAFDELSLDSSLIASSVVAFFPRHLSRYLSVENYRVSINRFCAIQTSFSQSLPICPWLFTS